MSKKEKEEDKVQGYKIKNLKTGLYLKSFGFKQILWTKKGKFWSSKGYISTSIKSAILNSRKTKSSIENLIINDIGNWEIVELKESDSYPFAFILDKINK